MKNQQVSEKNLVTLPDELRTAAHIPLGSNVSFRWCLAAQIDAKKRLKIMSKNGQKFEFLIFMSNIESYKKSSPS